MGPRKARPVLRASLPAGALPTPWCCDPGVLPNRADELPLGTSKPLPEQSRRGSFYSPARLAKARIGGVRKSLMNQRLTSAYGNKNACAVVKSSAATCNRKEVAIKRHTGKEFSRTNRHKQDTSSARKAPHKLTQAHQASEPKPSNRNTQAAPRQPQTSNQQAQSKTAKVAQKALNRPN